MNAADHATPDARNEQADAAARARLALPALPPLPYRPSWAGSVAAIARLTAGEALRSRFLVAVLVIGLISMLSTVAQGQAVSAADRLQLLRQSIIQTIGFVTTFTLLFLAAFALPTDLETRRVYTLVAKPVSRGTVFLGRLVGFALLALLLIVVLGLIGQVLLRIASATSGKPDGNAGGMNLAVAPRYLPVTFDAWGAGSGGRSSRRALPTISLDGPEEAGFVAIFAPIDPADFDAAGPTVQMRFSLRLHRNRHIRSAEVGRLSMRPLGAPRRAAVVREIQLRDRETQRFTAPWEAFGPLPPGHPAAGKLAMQLEFSLTESPFSAVLEPDSVVLLGRGADPAPAWGLVLVSEFARVLFVVAVVLAGSAVFTPYTSILGGFCALVVMSVASTFRSGVERYGEILAHAHRLQREQGRAIEPTLQFGEFLLGDPTDPAARWHVVTKFIALLPDATRFPISADFVAGYLPSTADTFGSIWMYGAWTVGAMLAGILFFSLREIP